MASTLSTAEPPAPATRRPPRLLLAAAAGSGLIALLLFASMLTDAAPFGWDRTILLAVRGAGGAAWVRAAMIDLTALGDGLVLTLVVLVAAGWLLVARRPLTAGLVVAATASGGWLAAKAKLFVARPRPDLVDHLVPVSGLSFPSGHATNSAIVYLTLASLVTQVERGRAERRYILLVALLLVGAIGVSRVYLGVHWPSDVLSGWCVGTLYALLWWWIGARLRRR